MSKTIETVNIRIYKVTHNLIKRIAEERRQDLIVVMDEAIRQVAEAYSVGKQKTNHQ